MSNITNMNSNGSVNIDREYEIGYSFETGNGVAQDYDQAQIHYRNSKSPLSDYRLGCMAVDGKLGVVDHKKAFRWISKSASAGYFTAKLKLAEFYAEGVGVDFDLFESARICVECYTSEIDEDLKKQAMEALMSIPDKCDEGSPMREYSLGLLFEAISTDKNYEEAISHYAKAGNAGHADALYRAGVLSEIKCPPDYTSAIGFYRKAYKSGDKRSAIRLGVLCYEGKSTPQDIGLSFRFFRKAADFGDHRGEYWSAIMMSCGILTEKDVKGAIPLFTAAYDGGVKAATVWLGIILRRGDDDVPRDPNSAFKWLKTATNYGFGRAMYELGQMYETGSGVRADMTQARKLYGMANRNGCPVIDGRIGPVDPRDILEGDFREVESEYLNTLALADHFGGTGEVNSDEWSYSEKDVESHSEAGSVSQSVPEPTETPVELLKRLKNTINIGGPDAEDTRREVLFLFESCFGLDSDFDAMWGLYHVALMHIPLPELKFRVAQMMADSGSPIYNMERAFEWFEDAYISGYRIAAISMGDYYLEGLGPFSKDLVKASGFYIDATRNRTEFRKVESRFDSIRKSIGDSGKTNECVTIAHMLDKSNVAGHDTVMGFYTLALEKGRSDVSKNLLKYCRRNCLKYDRPEILYDSLLTLKQNGDDDPLLMEGLREYSIIKNPVNGKKMQSSANTRNKSLLQDSDFYYKENGKEVLDGRLYNNPDSISDKGSCLKNYSSESVSKLNPTGICTEEIGLVHSESKVESRTKNGESQSGGNVNFKGKVKVLAPALKVSIPVLNGEEIVKLYPQVSSSVKKSVITSIENSIKMFIRNPDTGIHNIASLTSNPSKVLDIYQSIPESSLLDLIYKLGLRLRSDYEFVAYCLILTAALSNHKASLDICVDKIDTYTTQNMNLAVEVLSRSVSTYYPKSMFKLALLYERYPAYGSAKEANSFLMMAVELGDPDALKLVVSRMRNKECTQIELKNAEKSIREAADKGYSLAMLNRGEQCWNTDPEAAISWFTKAADKGNADAMCRLGIIFKDNSLFRNLEKAIFYLTKAGNLRNREALFHLGELFESIDIRKSQYYYRESSDLGCFESFRKLFKNDATSYKLSYHYNTKPIGIHRVIPDDSGRFMDNGFER